MQTMPVFHQFLLMHVKPLKNQSGSTARQAACEDAILDGYPAFVFVVYNVEMRRLMICDIHIYQDSVEATD